MLLAHRRGWPLLNLLSYALTLLTVTAWASDILQVRLSADGAVLLALLRDVPVHPSPVAALDGRGRRRRAGGARERARALSPRVGWDPVQSRRGAARVSHRVQPRRRVVDGPLAIGPAMRIVLWVAAILPLIGWMSDHHRWTWVAPSLVDARRASSHSTSWHCSIGWCGTSGRCRRSTSRCFT